MATGKKIYSLAELGAVLEQVRGRNSRIVHCHGVFDLLHVGHIGVGLNVIQGAVLVNAHPIVAIDLFDQKLDVARSFGATHCINARNEDVLAILQKLSDGRGIDVCVDTTGNRKVRETTYDATAPRDAPSSRVCPTPAKRSASIRSRFI
jgi:Zn-dependent alcohol dehydrogenase